MAKKYFLFQYLSEVTFVSRKHSMGRIFWVVFFLLPVCGFCQSSAIRHFEISVEPWGRIMGGGTFAVITDDSIRITYSRTLFDSVETYNKLLSKQERHRIKSKLGKIDLESLKDDYTNNHAGDCGGEFDFFLTIDEVHKKFHIYKVKVDPVFNLIAEINNMVPEKFRIAYNDEYFRRR